MTRISIRNTEVHRLAALLRGGATWEQAIATLRERISPSAMEAWRSDIEALAREPGPSLPLPPEPQPVDEREALESWRESLRRPEGAVTVVRSLGRVCSRTRVWRGKPRAAEATRLFASHESAIIPDRHFVIASSIMKRTHLAHGPKRRKSP